MKVKMILPALTEALSPFFRPIKYSLFPPLGLATLAGYLDPGDQVTLEDEHVAELELGDEPDLVGIEVYVTNADRAYAIADHYRARGVRVVPMFPELVKHFQAVFDDTPEGSGEHVITRYRDPGGYLRSFVADNSLFIDSMMNVINPYAAKIPIRFVELLPREGQKSWL